MHYIHLCMKQAGLPLSTMSSSANGILIIINSSVILCNKNKSVGKLIPPPEITIIPWAGPAILLSWGCVISWDENKDLNASFSNELCNNTPKQKFTQTEPIFQITVFFCFYMFHNIFRINQILSALVINYYFKCTGSSSRWHINVHTMHLCVFVISVCYDK